MGKSLLWGLTTPSEDDRIWNEYGNCTIPVYEYLFSTLGVCLPFTAFEVGVFNYRMVAPSQLHCLVRRTQRSIDTGMNIKRETLCHLVFSPLSLPLGYFDSAKRIVASPLGANDTYFWRFSWLAAFCGEYNHLVW